MMTKIKFELALILLILRTYALLALEVSLMEHTTAIQMLHNIRLIFSSSRMQKLNPKKMERLQMNKLHYYHPKTEHCSQYLFAQGKKSK